MNLKLRPVTNVFIVWSALICTPVDADQQANNVTSLSETDVSAQKEKAAIEMAKSELTKLPGMNAATLSVVSVEQHSWPDSSLGCRKPNQMAAQVITNGYIITIQSSKGARVVHATDKYAVVCERNMITVNSHHAGAPLRNLNDMLDKARSDLASKLHVDKNLVHIVTFVGAEWPDTSMECVVENEPVVNKPIKGYRIALRYAGRTYVYHTDMTRVRACPAIEVQ